MIIHRVAPRVKGLGGSEAVTRKLKVLVHKAEQGGYWAAVPAISGCATQGETFEELLRNINEAVEACRSIGPIDPQIES